MAIVYTVLRSVTILEKMNQFRQFLKIKILYINVRTREQIQNKKNKRQKFGKLIPAKS